MGLKSLLFPCVVLAMSMRVASNSITGSLQNMSGSEVKEDHRLLRHPKFKKCTKACDKKDLDCVKHTNSVDRLETCSEDYRMCYACRRVGNYTHTDCCANPDLIHCKKAWGATSAVETIYPTPAPTMRVQKKCSDSRKRGWQFLFLVHHVWRYTHWSSKIAMQMPL